MENKIKELFADRDYMTPDDKQFLVLAFEELIYNHRQSTGIITGIIERFENIMNRRLDKLAGILTEKGVRVMIEPKTTTLEEILSAPVNEYGWHVLEDGRWIMIGDNCTIGKNCKIGDYCTLRKNSNLGDDCTLGNGCDLDKNCNLGDGFTLGDGCYLGKNSNLWNYRS